MKFPVAMLCAGLLPLFLGSANAHEPADDKPVAPAESPAPQPGTRRALLICGLAGDAAHRKLFGETLELLHTGLVKNYAIPAENIRVLWGDEPADKDGPAVAGSQVATRESITQQAEGIRSASEDDDALWVIVLGHAHYDNKVSWLNIKGPDLSHVEFGKLFSGVKGREQVFIITTPVSGFFARSLATPGRVVMTATEADQEVNETIFPHKLAKNIATPPELKEFDVNEDGTPTLFDLYLLTVKETLQDYASNEFLATEHALLEDNGDGRATEVQLEYLIEDLGGRRRAGKGVPSKPVGDGEVANRLVITLPPPSPEAPEPARTGPGKAEPAAETKDK